MDQSPPIPPPTLSQEPQAIQQSSGASTNTTDEIIQEDVSAPAELQVETTHVNPVIGESSLNVISPAPQSQQVVEPAKTDAIVKPAEVEAVMTPSLTSTTPALIPDLEQISNVDVTELTTQIMDMINQEEDENDLTKTTLMKKNVELQEFMVKLIELLREKTNLSANLERQNTALTSQAKSLRDVINITKDLLNIRNMEVDHLHVDMGAMEKCIKEERERHNMAVQRLSEAMSLNDRLKQEYLNQMELFGKLRDKYNEKVMFLTKENQRLKELVKETHPEPEVSTSQEIIIQPNAVAPEETNGIL
uniref:Sorting nexin-4 n=1 Tax=Lygus hesperus TaxID=30085 RepID=A0A0A9Y0D0_LYGHE